MSTMPPIIKIVALRDLPRVATLPNRLEITVLTSGGSAVLEMVPAAVLELAEALANHLEADKEKPRRHE
jgi:hypothetical protein